MGITIVQKSDPRGANKPSKVALVLAGGAISGGAFKLGGLFALDSFLVNRKPIDMDIYVGLSAGAFLAAPLAAGVSSRELLLSIEGKSSKIDQLRPWDFYYPNWSDFVGKPVQAARDAAAFLPRLGVAAARFIRRRRSEMTRRARALVDRPTWVNLERFMGPILEEASRKSAMGPVRYLPSGLFDNSRIEAFIRRNLESNGVPNNFRLLHLERGNHLYIGATNLNTARGVTFGHDEDNSVSISEAVQASTAIPGFFRPARVGGEDYIDAGVRKTANISTAIRKGADLVIAYNPFRPYDNEFANTMADSFTSIADRGMAAVLNQTFRTLLHTRLHLGIEKLRLDNTFKGDVVLIEPSETDFEFFDMSPLAFWSRHKAARQGFASTKDNLERHYPRLQPLLRRHGIECSLDGLRGGAEELGLIAADPEMPLDPEFAAAAPEEPLFSSPHSANKRRTRLRVV